MDISVENIWRGGIFMENSHQITELLYPGKNVQIEVGGGRIGSGRAGDGLKLIQKASVQRMDHMYVTIIFSGPGNVCESLKPNTELTIICKHPGEQTDYVFFTQLIRVVGSSPPSALLRTPTEFNKGRQAARFEVSAPFSYFVNQQEFKDGTVQNMSMNGLLASIQPNQDLKEQDRVAVKLSIPNSPFPLLLSGSITRIIKQDQKYQIAMHFPYLAFDIQDKIVKFLFNAQKKVPPKAPEPKMYIPSPKTHSSDKLAIEQASLEKVRALLKRL
jgi:hypothetical protein